MATPALRFWEHFADVWFGPAPREDSITLAEFRRAAWDSIIPKHQEPLLTLLERWGNRIRVSSEFLDKDEIRRLLACLSDGYLYPELIQHGIWDHFKGGVYKVHGRAKWTGEEGGDVVLYTSLGDGETYARLVRVWNEIVRWPDGAYRTRFVRREDPSVSPPFKVIP